MPKKTDRGAQRPVIYQLIPRLFTNYCEEPVPGGTIMQNGSGKLNAINSTIIKSIKDLGCTHIWYTGVIEHAHDADYTRYGIPRHNQHVVKGHAGSPYAITDFYDIDPDLAEDVPNRLAEFEALVRRTHDAGMKVVIDFVPNHVARQYHSDVAPIGVEDLGQGDNTEMFFSPSNNFYYITRQQFAPHVSMGEGEDAYVEFPAKASGNDCFTAFPGVCDWYDTVKLNYGVDPANGSKHFDPTPPTWLKMLHILRFWASKGVDAFRCDMVHMVPVEFWHWAIANVKTTHPHVLFIAEIYDTALYRPYIYEGGFDYLYDKVTLYDTLRGIDTANVSAAAITSCWQAMEGIGDKMLAFLENHDEQRYASPQYMGDATKVWPALVVSAMLGRGGMMIYAGQEVGEPAIDAEGYSGRDGRTTIFDYWSVDKIRRMLNKGRCDDALLTPAEIDLRDRYRRVLSLINTSDALRRGTLFDLMYVNYRNPHIDPHRQFAFMRSDGAETLVIAVNFGSEPCPDLQFMIPRHAFDTLGIDEGGYEAVDLLSDRKTSVQLTADGLFASPLAAHDAAVWRLTAKKSKKAVKKSPAKGTMSVKK